MGVPWVRRGFQRRSRSVPERSWDFRSVPKFFKGFQGRSRRVSLGFRKFKVVLRALYGCLRGIL